MRRLNAQIPLAELLEDPARHPAAQALADRFGRSSEDLVAAAERYAGYGNGSPDCVSGPANELRTAHSYCPSGIPSTLVPSASRFGGA